MTCKKCGCLNPATKKTCVACGDVLEGFTINNVTGKPGYRNADGSFTNYVPESEPKSETETIRISSFTEKEKENFYQAIKERLIRWIEGDDYRLRAAIQSLEKYELLPGDTINVKYDVTIVMETEDLLSIAKGK